MPRGPATTLARLPAPLAFRSRALAAAARAVERFSDGLLRADLPGLPGERRAEASAFVAARFRVIAGPARLAVAAVALAVHALAALPLVGPRVLQVVRTRALPGIGEYARLVRSLAYAFVWERWPDSHVDGRPRTEVAA